MPASLNKKMPLSLLQQRLEATRDTPNPVESLYAIAVSLRDFGFSQAELYEIFMGAYFRHQDDKDESFYDCICEVLDCIWSGGYCNALRVLYPHSLTQARLRKYGVQLDETRGVPEITLTHPRFTLRFTADGADVPREWLRFLRENLYSTEGTGFILGTMENMNQAPVRMVKSAGAPLRYELHVGVGRSHMAHLVDDGEVGDFIGALMTLCEPSADLKPEPDS